MLKVTVVWCMGTLSWDKVGPAVGAFPGRRLFIRFTFSPVTKKLRMLLLKKPLGCPDLWRHRLSLQTLELSRGSDIK